MSRVEDIFEYLYERCENGEFDLAGDERLMSVKKVKKACEERQVEFTEFLNYAQSKKKSENEEIK